MKDSKQRDLFSGWRDLHKFLTEYWRAYGGWASLLKSPYLHLSILVTAATWPLWWSAGWWERVFSLIPSILGFTIGGFAIVLALGSGNFGAVLSSGSKPERDPLDSGLAKLSAAFCHFIIIQFLSIVLALLAQAFVTAPAPCFAPWLSTCQSRRIFWGIGWFFAVYSLGLAISTANWIFTNIKLLIVYQKLQGNLKAARRAAEQQERKPESNP